MEGRTALTRTALIRPRALLAGTNICCIKGESIVDHAMRNKGHAGDRNNAELVGDAKRTRTCAVPE